MKTQTDFSSMDFSAALDAMNPAKFMQSLQDLQKTWSGFAAPAGLTPTMDVDEIDKRIADLKSVEQWLTMNLSMLQSSVQALQVQRATIATLNTLTESVTQASQSLDAEKITEAMAKASQSMGQPPSGGTTGQPMAGLGAMDPTVWWNVLQTQFENIAASAMAPVAPATQTGQAKPGQATQSKDATPKRTSAKKASARTAAKSAKPDKPGKPGKK